MSIAKALERFVIADEHKGRTARFIGAPSFNLGGRIYDFEVEVADVRGHKDFEIIARPADPAPGDRALFLDNPLMARALSDRLAAFLARELGVPVPKIRTGSYQAQSDDRMIFVLSE